MKTLITILLLTFAQAHAQDSYREDLNAPEALALFRQTLKEQKSEMEIWLQKGRVEVPKIKASAAAKTCAGKGSSKACEKAIYDLSPYSVVPVRQKFIFQLGEDLKTKHRFDVNTGMKVFQLNTALRWLAKSDMYNGVPMPTVYNKTTYKKFVSNIETFLAQKDIELQKATPMIR